MNSTRFAKWVFTIAGAYGLLITFPLYFMEQRLSSDYPPPMNHLENYYTLIGLICVFQLVFFLIARDPLRYRPLMLLCVLEKMTLIPTFLILYPRGTFPGQWLPMLIIDLTLGALFFVSYVKTKGQGTHGTHPF